MVRVGEKKSGAKTEMSMKALTDDAAEAKGQFRQRIKNVIIEKMEITNIG